MTIASIRSRICRLLRKTSMPARPGQRQVTVPLPAVGEQPQPYGTYVMPVAAERFTLPSEFSAIRLRITRVRAQFPVA